MKSRWQKSLEAAVATYEACETQVPWSHKVARKAADPRRTAKPDAVRKVRRLKPRQPQAV